MRFHYSAAALALITTATLAEECPAGYAKAKDLAWTDCAKGENGSQLQCATIEVPKDWKDEASPKMKLHLVRQPAKTKSSRGERSVIINPGGPGSSGIQTVVEGGVSTQATLGDDLHLIGFDPRGVGLTIPYTCSNENEDENKKTARAVKEIEDQQDSYNQNVDLADKCSKKEADGALIGTAYVARDVKAIAESLGEDGLIRYIGYSYGTLLGATLAAMFPTKVDRIVLDGNINPQSYYHQLQTESATDTDSAYKRFFELCATASKGNCAWAEDGKDGAQLTTKFDDFLDSLTVDQSNVVRDKFFMVLYDPSKFKAFASTLQGWQKAPATIPQRGASDKDDKEKRDTFEVTAYANTKTPNAISAIACSDKITKLQGSPENYKKWLEEYRAVTKYGYDLSGAGDLQCSVWQTTAKERFDVPQSGIDTPNPILFVNTQYDPVTPMDSAVNSAKSFKKSVLLKSSGVGHCSNVNPSTDLNDAIREYMASGTTPKVTSYTPDKKNVFDEEEAEKAVTPGKASKRDFRYPDFFSKREEAPTAEEIPAGCTKIPVSSSALVSPSASVAPSASASLSVSLSASVSVSQSHEPTPSASASVSVSASASDSIVLSHSESASASVLVAPSASASESLEPTPSASLSVSASASVSVSQSPEPTPAASPSASASASDSIVLSHSESASASVLVTSSVSASESHEPTPSASLPIAASVSASESMVLSPSESASASILVSAYASVPASHEPSPSASALIPASASESLVLSNSESASASVSVQQPSEGLQASVTPSASQSESYAVSPTPSVSAHLGSATVSVAHVSSSVQHSEVNPSASVSVAGEQGSQSSSAVISVSVSADLYSSSAVGSASASASVSVDYPATASSVAHSPSYPTESLTPSASATPVYNQGSASITASASYSAASSAEHVSSSGLYLSADVQVPQSESSYPASVPSSSAHASVSSSAYPDSSSSAHVSGSASQAYSVPVPTLSTPHSDSSVVHPSASSSAVYPDTSVYLSGSSSVVYSQSSQYPSGSSSSIEYFYSSVVLSSSTGSYYPVSTPAYSSGSSTGSEYPKTKPVHDRYPTSKPYASSTPVRSYSDQSKSVDSKYSWSSVVPSYPSSVPSYPEDLPAKSVDYKGGFSTYVPARSSSIPSYPKGGDYPGGGDYPSGNVYPTGFYPVTTSGKPKGPKTTSAPCITVPWSSQPGYVPITKTYTTTTVRTVTKCPDTVKNCPLNSSSKTYITTETKTRTIVVATPSPPPTGNKSYPPNKESGMNSSPPSKETGKVPSPPKDSGYPSQPAKDTGKSGQPPKETKPISPSQPPKDTGYPSQPSKPTGNSPQPPKETKPIQSSHSAYAPPNISSKPSVPTSVPPYPTGPSAPSSVKVCNDMKCSYVAVPTGTKPIVGTGASTTLRTSTPSVSVCFGKDCKAAGTPTGGKPAEFTGAASSNFMSSMVGAGAMIVAFARFF